MTRRHLWFLELESYGFSSPAASKTAVIALLPTPARNMKFGIVAGSSEESETVRSPTREAGELTAAGTMSSGPAGAGVCKGCASCARKVK